MVEIDYPELQERYGGRYVAHRNGEVVVDAATYSALIDELETRPLTWDGIVIEFVEPPDVVGIY